MDAVAWLTPSSFSMMNLSASVTSENGRDSPAVIWPSRDTWLNHSTLAGWLKSKPVRSMANIPYLAGTLSASPFMASDVEMGIGDLHKVPSALWLRNAHHLLLA